MPKIKEVRPILLSVPYDTPKSREVQLRLSSGYRTCGMVEITLEDGTKGIGEGYLAVFAPKVFVEIANLIAPYLIGKEVADLCQRYRDMQSVTGYWSLQGAAQHVISAFDIAMHDAYASFLNVPAYHLLGGKLVDEIDVYGSGGSAISKEDMLEEIALLNSKGIRTFKIRARNYEVEKTLWVMRQGEEKGFRVAVDMCQNLAVPSQSLREALNYVEEVHSQSSQKIAFLEEALGPMDLNNYKSLREKCDTKICGGEVITTPEEMCSRIEQGFYDFVQPDATVIGGMSAVMTVFEVSRQLACETVVHCWGGPICMMANYHCAFAGGSKLIEWPMPKYVLRDEMMKEPLVFNDGKMSAPTQPGLGIQLTDEIEAKYPFREDAVYDCSSKRIIDPPNSYWRES